MFVRDNAMTPLTKTITAVFLIGLFATSLACEAKTDTNTKGKFHLIYLVSAEKLEVGAKVFVEPLFATDGKSIQSMRGVCIDSRRKHKRNNRISSVDRKVIARYCANKTFSFEAKNYHIFDNLQNSIRLDAIEFRPTRYSEGLRGSQDFIEPNIILIGKSVVKKVVRKNSIVQLSATSKGRLNHFFLMSRNKNILNGIIIRLQNYKPTGLVKNRITSCAEKYKGAAKYSSMKKPLTLTGYGDYKVNVYRVLSLDIADSSKTDIIFGMRTGNKSYGIGYLDHRNNCSLISNYGFRQPEMLLAHGYTLNTPLVLIKVRSCSYLLFSEVESAFFPNDFVLHPIRGKECKRIRMFRQMQDMS